MKGAALSAGRTGLLLVLFCSLPLLAEAPAEAPAHAEKIFSTLADLPFEGEMPPTGPDTFAVFAKESGQVRRSYHFRVSGEESLEISDRAGDGAFPELQGYFDERRQGVVYCHFAFLTTTPQESFNIALAGPEFFALRKNGIAFWLEGRDGKLVHWSDSMPKKLFELQGFTWYFVDLRYNLQQGHYDLTIHQEGLTEPIVALEKQPNATATAGSSVDKFSFIGDRGEDTSKVVYYVDDIRIEAGGKVPRADFVAPGRRKLFIEMPKLMSSDAPPGEAELEGDRLLRDGNALAARDLYLSLAEEAAQPALNRLWLKLADAYWLLGDVENEREIREAFFGSLP